MPRFSCSIATPSRKRSVQETNGSSKVPRASEVSVVEGPSPAQRLAGRLPAVAPVVCCIYKVTDCAGDVWDSYSDQSLPLWQVQIDHVQQRPVTFQMRDAFNDFLRTAHAGSGEMPANVRDS